jgi:tetratricopeptide (TPR) repeat protein
MLEWRRWMKQAIVVLLTLGVGVAQDAGVAMQKARTLLEENRISEALREVETVLKSRPQDPELQFEVGEFLQDLASSRSAMLERLAPDSEEVHELLGQSWEAQGKLSDAVREYRAALKLAPHSLGLHFRIGNVLWKTRDFEAAQPELEAELEANPNHSLANLRLGEILLAKGENEHAVTPLRRATQGDPALLEAHRQLGKALRLTGDNGGALKELRLVAARRPDDDSIHAQLAAVYKSMGDPAHAAAEMKIHSKILEKKRAAARRPEGN